MPDWGPEAACGSRCRKIVPDVTVRRLSISMYCYFFVSSKGLRTFNTLMIHMFPEPCQKAH